MNLKQVPQLWMLTSSPITSMILKQSTRWALKFTNQNPINTNVKTVICSLRIADTLLENIDETNNSEYGLLVEHNLQDEGCLGVFISENPWEDKLPISFLHSSDCWHGTAQPCPNLPITDEHDEGVLIDYDFDDPTLHYLLDELVYGDTSLPGCYMDWMNINKMINENA